MVTDCPSPHTTLDLRLTAHRWDMMMVMRDKLGQARQWWLHLLRDLAT